MTLLSECVSWESDVSVDLLDGMPLRSGCMGWLGLVSGYLAFWLKGFTMDLINQFKFPSPFTRAYLNSPQLVQEALDSLNIGPFQSDGELLCMCFLKPSEDPPNADERPRGAPRPDPVCGPFRPLETMVFGFGRESPFLSIGCI